MQQWEKDNAKTMPFIPLIQAIMGRIILVVAPVLEDQKHNTDLLVLKADGVRIGVRIRGDEYRKGFGDQFTIRSDRPNGCETELKKIEKGWGDWFFYGFVDYKNSKLTQYVVVDLKGFRSHLSDPLVSSVKDISNKDGSSSFRSYKLSWFGPDVIKHRWSLPLLRLPTLDIFAEE